MYDNLMRESGFELYVMILFFRLSTELQTQAQKPIMFPVVRDGQHTPHVPISDKVAAPANQKLAERFYRLRFDELRGLILVEEQKFKYTLYLSISDALTL